MSHLRPETIFGYEHGLLLPDELRAVHEHIDSCPACRELVADRMGAQQMTAELKDALAADARASSWLRYAAAAAVALAVLGSAFWMRGRITPEPELAAIRLPAFLTELADERRELMGTEASPGARLVSPRATAVLGPEVAFTWTALEGAGWRYVVRVFRVDDQPVVASGELAEPRWTSPALAADVSYQWQVTATRPGAEPVTLPGPSDRPPRFRVLNRAAISAIPSGDSLRRGIAYANAGLLDEARGEFREAARSHPQEAAARLAQLDKGR